MSGPIGLVQKGMLRFLNCFEKESVVHAKAVWDELRKVTGSDDEYELQAAWLLSEALWGQPRQSYTRTQLRHLDSAVVKAANALQAALRGHPDFSKESSAANWPDEYAKRMATALRGLPVKHASNQLWPGIDMHNAMQEAYFAGLFRELPQSIWPWSDRTKDGLFFLVAELSLTMAEMLDVLTERARARLSARFKSNKSRTKGQAIDTDFIRRQLFPLMVRNPDATAGQAARIVSPIVNRSFGTPLDSLEGKRMFARCKKIAQGIRDDIGD